MTALGSIGGAMPSMTAAPTAMRPVTPVQPAGAPGSDGGIDAALAPMSAAMDRAIAVGTPTTKADAAAILDTHDDFLAGAQGALGALDQGMLQRRDRLASGTASPAQQAEDREQLGLMQVLRDRIQQSVDHAARLLAGDDPEATARRDALLAPAPRVMQANQVDPTLVAGAYARGGFGEHALASGG